MLTKNVSEENFSRKLQACQAGKENYCSFARCNWKARRLVKCSLSVA